MSGCIQAFELDSAANLYDIARTHTSKHVRNSVLCIGVRDDLRSGRRNESAIATGMIAVLMGIEYLRDGPVVIVSSRQALVVIQWINGQRLAGFRTGDQVIKVPVRVRGPDLLDYHDDTKS